MFFEFLEMVEGRSILTYVDKVCVVICANQNRVRSMILEFLLIVEGVKSIHHIVLVCVVGEGAGPDKRLQKVASVLTLFFADYLPF